MRSPTSSSLSRNARSSFWYSSVDFAATTMAGHCPWNAVLTVAHDAVSVAVRLFHHISACEPADMNVLNMMTLVASSEILLRWIYLSTSRKKFCGFSLSLPLNSAGAVVVAIGGNCVRAGTNVGVTFVFDGALGFPTLGTLS